MRPTLVSLRQRLRHSLAGTCHRHTHYVWPGGHRPLQVCWTAVLAVPQMVAAQSQPRSSGGYTRPGGYSPRTPSFGGSAAARRPSVSGGYGRPSSSMPGRSSSSWSLPRSASDQALARQSSREALDAFRQRCLSPRATRVGLRSGRLGRGMGRRRRDPVRETRAAREDWYGRSGWSPAVLCRPHPAPVWHVGRDVRVVSAQYHCRSPGMPTSSIIMPLIRAIPPGGRKRTGGPHADPSVRQKLAELDARLAAMQEKPRSSDYVPPDTTP